jgi:folate-binding protein YgfZ
MTEVSTISKSALADKLAIEGATTREYAGVETPAHFGDPKAEFAAITLDCGVYDLGWRGKITVTGEDRFRWLNGMVTNNIKDLQLNHGNYNFLLNAQGRIQGDMYAYNRGIQIVLDTERSQVAHLMKTLDHFIIMDDVELSDVSERLTSIGVQGPKAKDVLQAVGIKPECADPLVVCDLKWNGTDIAVTRMASDDFLTYEIWLAPEAAPALWEALKSAGAKPTGAEALEKFRVMAGIPKYGTDIRDRELPQETGQTHALNFTKGCYIGQEIVERIRSQGNLHRQFTGYALAAAIEMPAKVEDESRKEVGQITSIATIPASSGERSIGLGYVRREARERVLTANGVSVKPATLPFKL